MFIYLLVNIFIIFFGLLSSIMNKKSKLTSTQNNGKVFTVFCFLILFFFSAFRGDFAADYKSYIYFFNTFKQISISEIFSVQSWQEIGYTWLNVIVGEFSQHELAIMVSTTFLTLLLFFIRFVKDSAYIWISILMFVSVGTYYTSFNIIRQMLAIAIVFAGAGFLYKNQFIKYIIVVIFASLFHVSALVMIPLGFMLKKFKPTLINITLLIPGIIVGAISIDYLVSFIMRFIYTSYTVDGVYGMEPINFKILVVPVAISIFALVYSRLVNLNDEKSRIWINAVLFYLIFAILSLSIKNFNRIGEYFLPFLYLLVPVVISKLNKNDKILYFTLIPTLLTIYVYITFKGSGFDPYYFYWNK